MFSWLMGYFVLTRNFQEHTDSNFSNRPFGELLCETQGAGLRVSQWKIFIRNKTMSYKNC